MKINPCPFCKSDRLCLNDHKEYYNIYCMNCGAHGPKESKAMVEAFNIKETSHEQHVFKNWNEKTAGCSGKQDR
jgi:hypothetical protein